MTSFDVQILLLSWATGFVSSGELSGLTSMAAKCAKLRVTILLPLETRKVASGNTVISSPNFVTKTLLHLTQLIIVVIDKQILVKFHLKIISEHMYTWCDVQYLALVNCQDCNLKTNKYFVTITCILLFNGY